MPSVLYFGKGGDDWNKDYPVDPRAPVVFYMLPPIRYSDGTTYIFFFCLLSCNAVYDNNGLYRVLNIVIFKIQYWQVNQKDVIHIYKLDIIYRNDF